MHFNPQQPGIGIYICFQPELLSLKERITEKIRILQTQIITEEEALDQILDIVNEKQDEVDALESKQLLFDKEIEIKKEEMTKQYQQIVTEVQERETRINNMKKHVQESGEKKQQQLQDLQQKADQREAELNEEVDEFRQLLLKACHIIMEHKTVMSKSVKDIEEKATKALQETKSFLPVPHLE